MRKERIKVEALKLLEESNKINRDNIHEKYFPWKFMVSTFIERRFGIDSVHFQDFKSIDAEEQTAPGMHGSEFKRVAYARAIDKIRGLLGSIVYEVENLGMECIWKRRFSRIFLILFDRILTKVLKEK